jgi:pimeloyl-ACP methyl ester carboxylesterase
LEGVMMTMPSPRLSSAGSPDVRANGSATARLFAAPPPVRAAFRSLEFAAPGLGARWAERIWMTLPRRTDRRGRSDREGRVAAVPPGVPFTTEVGAATVAGQSWGDGPTVYLVHGWAGYGSQLIAFVAPLLARGCRVVVFDAPSHGSSAPGRYGPRSASIPEFAAALTAVVAVHGPARAIVAHSMGATATAVALCDGLTAERTVLLAPVASPLSHARGLAAVLGFGDRTHRRLITRVERRVGAPMHHFDVPALGRAVRMPPTLVVHDRADRSTPVGDGMEIAAAWPEARLHVTTGLGHTRLLRDPDVVSRVADFVAPSRTS